MRVAETVRRKSVAVSMLNGFVVFDGGGRTAGEVERREVGGVGEREEKAESILDANEVVAAVADTAAVASEGTNLGRGA